MKHFMAGVGIFSLGFTLICIYGGIWSNGSDSIINVLILIAILYLSAVIAGATSMILSELREQQKE